MSQNNTATNKLGDKSVGELRDDKAELQSECALFDVNIPVQRETILEYFVYPADEQSTDIRLNVRFASGCSLVDFEQEHVQTNLKTGQWNRVCVKLGAFMEEETIRLIGMYRANVYREDPGVLYIDALAIRDSA